MSPRLHTGGRFRRRLAAVLGRDEDDGDRLWRRLLHGIGALVLVYYLLPPHFFVVLSKEAVLLLGLSAVAGLEVGRLGFGWEVPTIRPYEADRPASYLFYAVALVAAILLFPEPIAVAVVLGTALVDPLAGELRQSPRLARAGPGVCFGAYVVLAGTAFLGVGRWPWEAGLALAAVAAALAVPAERLRYGWLDDDLTMTLVPAAVLYGLAVGLLHLPT